MRTRAILVFAALAALAAVALVVALLRGGSPGGGDGALEAQATATEERDGREARALEVVAPSSRPLDEYVGSAPAVRVPGDRLALRPATGLVVARLVSDPDARPLAGVRVSAIATETAIEGDGTVKPTLRLREEGTGVADERGIVELRVRAGVALELFVEVALADAGLRRRDVEALAPGERRELAIALPVEGGSRAGRVLAFEDDAPIAGARIVSRAPFASTAGIGRGAVASGALESDEGPVVASASSAYDGSFEIATPLAGDAYLSIDAPGRAPAIVALRRRDFAREPILVRLARASAIRARVVGRDGAPAEGVELRVAIRASSFVAGDAATGLAPSLRAWQAPVIGGECRIDGLPDGYAIVEVLRAGAVVDREAAEVVLEPGATRDLVLRIDVASEIRGTRVAGDDGAPRIETIWLVRAGDGPHEATRALRSNERPTMTTTVDARGEFAFAGVAPGAWWVGVAPRPGARPAEDGDRPLVPDARLVRVAERAIVDVVIGP